ncbi:MAG: formylglycine-generating enzyme family protein, partial [Verrucomicrobiota bacterium]
SIPTPAAPPASTTPGQVYADPYTSMNFRWVPNGSFYMGAAVGDAHNPDANALSNEAPVHQVTFAKGFWMSEQKIRQSDWAASTSYFVGGVGYVYGADTSRPVENVSWNQLADYLTSINTLQGWQAYRLPSEAEWEYAYRAQAAASTNTPYWWGLSALTNQAWYAVNASSQTQPANTATQTNAWNLIGMAGNVKEWVADNYQENYLGVPTNGTPFLNPAVTDRTIRGSAWNDPAANLRGSIRYNMDPATADRTLGFRIVMPDSTAPRIMTLTATSGAAGHATLNWTTTNATTLLLDGVDVTGTTSLAVSGTAGATTYHTLVAKNANGWSMATLKVVLP